jgi:hypothetical protein
MQIGIINKVTKNKNFAILSKALLLITNKMVSYQHTEQTNVTYGYNLQ